MSRVNFVRNPVNVVSMLYLFFTSFGNSVTLLLKCPNMIIKSIKKHKWSFQAIGHFVCHFACSPPHSEWTNDSLTTFVIKRLYIHWESNLQPWDGTYNRCYNHCTIEGSCNASVLYVNSTVTVSWTYYEISRCSRSVVL